MAKRLVGYLQLLSQVVCLRFNVFYYLMVIQSCYIIQVNNSLRVTIELPRECEMSTDPETRFLRFVQIFVYYIGILFRL